MDISGKITQLLSTQTGQGKNGPWKKQEFVLETGDTYPKKVCIAVWGDKIDMNRFKPGDAVDVSFDVESREFNGKWYTDVKAWKVMAAKAGSGETRSTPAAPPSGNTGMPVNPVSLDDDLPF